MTKTQAVPKIKTFEDACKALKLRPQALPDVSGVPEKHQAALIAHFKLIIIAEALNEGWQPNWNDSNEYKYYPYFWIEASAEKPAGFGFAHSTCDYTFTHTTVGSRLCYRTRELSDYAAKQFKKLYQEYLLIQ